MKRKRGYGRRKPKNPKIVGAIKQLLNSDSTKAKDHSGLGNSGNEAFESKVDFETARAGSSLRYKNAALEDLVFIEDANGDNQIHESNLLKNVASFAAKLSKDVGSSSADLFTSNIPSYIEKEPRLSHQDAEHNEKELDAALLVIKKIMKMDAAKPFNSPVDPVSLRIPDYFDVIDTPMDFGTICNTIKLGLKYTSSKDVYKDVELIWSNCCKYNKDGSYILELMKRVKNNFMKHWNAAGLYSEEANKMHLEGNTLQDTEDGRPHSEHGCPHQAGCSIRDSFQGEPDLTGQCKMQQKHHIPCCSHLNQLQQVFSQCQCQLNYRELQSSQAQNGRTSATYGPMTGNTNHQKQHMCSDHNHRYQQPLICAEQYHQPYQKSHQCYSNSSKFMGTKPDDTHTCSAGHSHMDSPVESSMRFAKHRLEYPVASVTTNQSHQHHCQIDPCQLHPPPMVCSHSYHPQNKCCHCHLDPGQQGRSLPLDGANIGVSGHSYMPFPTESAVRHTKHTVESSTMPVTDDGNHEQQRQMDRGESESPSSHHSQSPEPKGNAYLSRPSTSPPPEPSQIQAEDNHCNQDSPGMMRKTRGRGPTRCLSLLKEGKRISITTDELGEPVGPEAPKLINYLGALARDGHMAPLTYSDWRALPEANKEKMWEEVQTKFEINPSSKTWVLKSLGRKWKDWKAKLKIAHYITHATDEERLVDRDERVLPDQWAYLVSHWSSEEAEKRSATNRANRAQLKFGHVKGTKSFARIREEERAKRPDGKIPSRAELFILTRTRKDGKPVNEASSAVITQLREIAGKQQDTSENATPADDLFSQVVGRDKRGRLRCRGLGPSPSESGARKITHAEAIKMVSDANNEVGGLKERLVAMEQTCAQMASQMATMIEMMSSLHKSFPDGKNPDPVSNNSGTVPLQQVNSTPLRRSKRRAKV